MESSSTPAMDRRPSTPFSIESNPDQEFRLRWNNYQANLAQVFDQLLQSESFVDVTLTTDEGQSLKCHKVMLSACSPYFQQLFMENPCQHPIGKNFKIFILFNFDFFFKTEFCWQFRARFNLARSPVIFSARAIISKM